MDFDEAKENIQPLAQGRNPSILQASIRVDSLQDLMAQRKDLEREIHNYTGEDPLSVWFTYIEWIEQSFPSGGKESGLQEVLAKCLSRFESHEQYFQDRRMIKLYIKYIDSVKDPAECYQQLYNSGIGTMVSDFYIAWAYCYDLVDNTRKADEIFRRGISCRAQPLEDLQEAHQHFGFTVAQRLMYKDDDGIKEETNRQLHERRLALSSLRGHRRQQLVGSTRTGAAIKHLAPGTVKVHSDGPSSSHQRNNARVQVFTEENKCPNASSTFASAEPPETAVTSEENRSVVRSIMDAQRDQENLKEPGPWSKSHKKGQLFKQTRITNDLGFEIHEDGDIHQEDYVSNACVPPIPMTREQSTFDKPIKLPPNFCNRNRQQLDWIIPVTTEENPDRNTIPEYNKCKSYPRPNMEFQPEELRAYSAFKKRSISNTFTKKRDLYWSSGPHYNIRQYPHFAKKSNPQNLTDLDTFFMPQKILGMQLPFDDIYNMEEKVERQYEEILSMRIKRNETITQITDMEETICVSSEKVVRRKSFYPMRKSMAPCANVRGAVRKVSLLPTSVEENEVERADNGKQTTTNNQSSTPAIFEDRETIETPKLLSKLSRLRDPEISKTKIETPKALSILPINAGLSEAPKELQAHSVEAFTIFQDESFVAKPKIVASTEQPRTLLTNDEFLFKTPALPTNVNPPPGVMVKPNKIHFEIFEDIAANSIPKPDTSCGTGGYFDSDESCSTQTFNIFLRAQSVSTPKPKSDPQRHFGNILKEAVPPPPVFDQKDDDSQPGSTLPVTDHSDENCPVAITTVFSPLRKQLSTILETSENGTTQSTHTTGATTKSTISSPESEQESQVQTITGSHHVATLETVRERTLEGSITQNSALDTVEEKLSSMQIESESKIAENNSSRRKMQSPHCTPGMVRSEPVVSKRGTGGLDFSIFEESVEGAVRNVGNFSRLVEREDTATGYAIKPVRFEEDKTETITKVLLAPSQPFKFQEDKTETIPAMLLAPPPPIKFQEGKTETISEMLVAPSQPIRFQEDKTETISKYLLAPPQPGRFEDDRTETLPQLVVNETGFIEARSRDDFFEFFSQSPPKLGRANNSNPLEKGPLAHIRTGSENLTPLTKPSKRFCDKLTPDMQKYKSKHNTVFANVATTTSKSVLGDSFMSDFLDTQPKQAPSKIPKPKSVLRDSFIPDFSLIEDSQPQKQLQKTTNQSYLPDIQPAIKNHSFIADSQPMHSTSGLSRQGNPNKNALQSSYLPDFSFIPETQQPLSNNNEGQPSGLKNILTDTFMKDFSEIKEPQPIPRDVKETTMLQPGRNNSTLKYLEESMSQKSISKAPSNSSMPLAAATASKESKLSFHPPNPAKNSLDAKKLSVGDKFFELNAETEMFATNLSMIRNSTWLPNHGPTTIPTSKQPFQIQEDSIHIKDEISSSSSSSLSSSKRGPEGIVAAKGISADLPRPKLSFLHKSTNEIMSASGFSIDVSQWELDAINNAKIQQQENTQQHSKNREYHTTNDDGDFGEMSIYYNHTPKTPKAHVHVWDVEDSDSFKTPANNRYTHAETDLNQTLQILENARIDPNVNPFNVDVINAFLEQIQFTNYMQNIPRCMLVGCIHRLKAGSTITVHSIKFQVTKLIGEGAYGAVFLGKGMSGGKNVALKQEKPANLWEYYICLEIQDRIRIDEMLPAFMSVDYALIGNNCSVLISQFSQYGSLITVCNKIKKHTLKNVDEYVVMVMACELLETMDHLHAISIIHADIKADNILLMNKVVYPSKERFLQLIDFGVSIDMKLFKPNQTFSYVHTDNTFKCVEMREQRPWTYQLDLYGLAGALHVLLFGKYMDIAQKPSGIWMHKTHVPRYFHRNLWETIFKELLNIRDCNSMPNLQNLRALLKEQIEEKEKYVTKMVNEFNKALDM